MAAALQPPAAAGQPDLPKLLGRSSGEVFRVLGHCTVDRVTPLRLTCALAAPAPPALISFDDAMQVEAIEFGRGLYRTLGPARASAALLLALMAAGEQEMRRLRSIDGNGPGDHLFSVDRHRFAGRLRLRSSPEGWRVDARMADPTFRPRSIPTR